MAAARQWKRNGLRFAKQNESDLIGLYPRYPRLLLGLAQPRELRTIAKGD
jgi:hypothetical protein